MKLRLGVAFVVGCMLSACTIGSPVYKTYNAAPGGGGETSVVVVCDSPTVAVDLASLAACGNGQGHCYDKTKVPGVGTLPTEGCAATEVCVPDSILKANGKKLNSCESIIGDGACVSTLIVEIDRNKGPLGQGSCATGEACVPCKDPQHGNAPTPFCLEEGIGVHQDACTTTGGTTEETQRCCLNEIGKPVGVCIAKSGVPEGQRGSVSQDLCKSPDEACVPEALTAGEFTKCSAGYSGVCVDPCFVGLTNSKLLFDGGCPDGQKCVPCLFGKGQGLPGCQGEDDPAE